MYEIEKGIERPKIVRHGKPAQHPWRTMEVGDSFFIPGGKKNSSRAAEASKRTGYKFSGRTVEGGYRIWRIA